MSAGTGNLHLYNSMSREKEEFRPRNQGRVDMFTCGPSTYRRPHIGNYRTFLYEDLVVRYLTYLGFDVHRVINFTDVEDKTIIESEHRGRDLAAITNETAEYFMRETRSLGIRLPESIPRSSTSVKSALKIIKRLVEKGHAYWHKGSVFFDPLTIKRFGRLYRLDMGRWPQKRVRFKRDTYNGNRWNLGDFILWHGSTPESATWETEIGGGRPSWNVQDPAMILQEIGTQVDINCGGIDNIYRHHDYNIAVMEAYSGTDYANYYMHGAHLVVEGTPMSKSRGNILYPEDVTRMGFSPKHLRFFLTHTHYRTRLNFTEKSIAASAARLDSFRTRLQGVLDATSSTAEVSEKAEELIAAIEPTFRELMNDDLRSGDAFDEVSRLVDSIADLVGDSGIESRSGERLRAAISAVDEVFGVLAVP